MIKAVIFDMDGLLVNSQPVWQAAQIEVFKKVGLRLTVEMTKQTMGLRSDEVVGYWYNRYPWTKVSQSAVDADQLDTVVRMLGTMDVERPGVQKVINMLEKRGLPLAIASSSQLRVIRAALSRLRILDRMRVVSSAEHEPYGKPHPGVYISAARKLGVEPEFCLAFEDSGNGVLAAKAAKMKCIVVPDAKQKGNKLLAIADMTLPSLADFRLSMLEGL